MFSYGFSHISDLQRILKKLKSAGVTLQRSKCLIDQCSITHLGFHYSVEGVTPKAIVEWPVKSAKELRSFLRFTNFYWNFIPGFTSLPH